METATSTMTTCSLCFKPINSSNNQDLWKEVKGWVGGPKKDSMRMREDTGRFAHNYCVEKIQSGQTPDQPSMFEEVNPSHSILRVSTELPEELQ